MSKTKSDEGALASQSSTAAPAQIAASATTSSTPDSAAIEKSKPLRSMQVTEFLRRTKHLLDLDKSTHEIGRRDSHRAETKFAFFLGAGCSITSGIPAAGELVRKNWLARLRDFQEPAESDPIAFAKKKWPDYTSDNAANFYGRVMDELFVTANDRQCEIESLCDGKYPSFGYVALAQMVAHDSSAFNVVLTTNFDDLMADALYLSTPKRPLVIHHESLAGFIRPTRSRPLVVKLHGDSRLAPKNTLNETDELDKSLAQHIAMLLNDRGLIFMGYGGNDESILKLLTGLPSEAVPSGIFWLSTSEPHGKVREWLSARGGFWIKIDGFDQFMLRVFCEFGFKHPSKDEFDRMFTKYFETFRDMQPKIAKPDNDAAPDPMLVEAYEKARAKLPEGFGEVARAQAMAESKPAEAAEVLQKMTKTKRTSASAQVAAARTLRDDLHKHGEAVKAFESALDMAIAESGESSAQAMRIRAELAWTRVLTGDLTPAATEIDQALAWAESQTPRDESLLAVWYSWRSRIRRDRGDLAGAEADIKKSIDWGEAQSPRDERSLAIWYVSRAIIRQNRGDLAGAETDIKKSIDWGEAQSPRDERGLAIRYASRASISQDRGDLAGAEADLKKSIDWFEAQSPRDERELAIHYASRARILRGKKQFPQALAAIERSLVWAKIQQPIHDWYVAVWSGDRATILAEMDRVPEAVTDIAACIAWHRQHQPDRRDRMAQFLRDQARILAIAGDWEKANASIDESLPLHEAVFGADHEWTKKARALQAAMRKREIPPSWLDTKP